MDGDLLKMIDKKKTEKVGNIIILKPDITFTSEVKRKNGDIDQKSKEQADILISFPDGRTVLKHHFKEPVETKAGDTIKFKIQYGRIAHDI